MTSPRPDPPSSPHRTWALHWHLLLLVLAVLLPAALFSTLTMQRLLAEERQALQKRIEEKAAQLSASVDAELRQSFVALEVMSLSNAVVTGDLDGIHRLARRVTSETRAWDNVMLLSPTGGQIVNPRLPLGTDLPPLTRPDLPRRAAQERRPVVSDMAVGAVSGEPLTAIYLPVVQDEHVRYVLAAAITPQNWKEILSSRMSSDMYAVLLDNAANVIASTHDERAHSRTVSYGGPEVGAGPGTRYASSSRVPLSGWTVVAFIPEETVAATLKSSLRGLGLGLGVLMLVAATSALVVGRSIARSVNSLACSVRAVAEARNPPRIRSRVMEVQEAERSLADTAALVATNAAREAAARRELEAASRAKNEFLAVLGHELRNPLAAIRNAVEIQKKVEPGAAAAAWARGAIDRQSVHLVRLVDDLLDVARIERGKLELREETLDLQSLLAGVLEDNEKTFRSAGQSIAFDAPGQTVLVHGDRTRLAQVFGNLLHNAGKFTPAGGEVRVTLAANDDVAVVTVRDTGIGIAPETLATMFEPFVQAQNEQRSEHGGLGLGLALVRRLVELHGGCIVARSEGVGRGAEFEITLPRRAAPPN